MAPPPAMSPAARALGAGAMVVAGLGFAVLFFFQVEPPPDAGQSPPRGERTARPVPRGPFLEVYRDELCFVNADGDDTPDPVVWMSEGKDKSRVAVVDGRTGQGLWASAAVEGRLPLACAGKDRVLAAAGEASLRALDARTGAELWSAAIAAGPEEIVTGEGCAAVFARSGAASSVALGSGAVAPCPSAPRPEPFSGPRWERSKNPRSVQAGDVELRLSAATEGDPKLTLEGLRGGAASWARPLDARAPGSRPELMIVVAGGMAVIAGADPATGARMRFVGVDAGSGEIRYTRPAGWAGPHVPAMAASGERVVVIAGGSLRALDAATGEEVWRAVAPATLP